MFDVVTIGTLTRDVFLRSDAFRVLHDPAHLERLGFPTGEAQCFALGSKIQVDAPVMTVGGGAANAAVTFARQGLRTALVCKIGAADRHGAGAIAEMKREGVTVFAAADRKNLTGYSAILLSPNGERTILNYRGASSDLTLRDVPLTRLRARAVYITPGEISLPTIRTTVKHFRAQGALVAMNPSRHYLSLGVDILRPLLGLLDVVIMNREEAAYLTGHGYGEEHHIFKKFDDWVPGVAVMTDGPRGVLVSDGRRLYEAGTFPERAVRDRTGSGDAFGGGFVASLVQSGRSRGEFSEHDIRNAIRVGSANATSVVEHVGAQTGILTARAVRSGRWRQMRLHVKELHG